MKFIRVLLALPFIALLFMLTMTSPILIASSTLVTSTELLKEALVEGDVYNTIVEEVLNEALTEAMAGEDLPVDNALIPSEEELLTLVDEVELTEFIQTEIEAVIDEFFLVFNREKDDINHTIDLTPVVEDLVAEMKPLFKQKVDELPDCTDAEILELTEGDVETLTCLPAQMRDEFDTDAMIDQVSTELLDTETGLNLTITTKDLNMTEADIMLIQDTFTMLRYLPYILAIFFVVLVGIVVLLIPSTSGGLITTGVFATLAVLFSYLVNTSMALAFDPSAGYMEVGADIPADVLEALQQFIQPIVERANIVSTIYLMVGITLIVAGGVLSSKKKQKPSNEVAGVTEVSEPQKESLSSR